MGDCSKTNEPSNKTTARFGETRIADLIAQADSALSPQAASALDVAHRNGLRLLKLVNTLLDFSRIEAGRIDASYEPTDLAVLTAELASAFRSAIEKAGLGLVVQCDRSRNRSTSIATCGRRSS